MKWEILQEMLAWYLCMIVIGVSIGIIGIKIGGRIFKTKKNENR